MRGWTTTALQSSVNCHRCQDGASRSQPAVRGSPARLGGIRGTSSSGASEIGLLGWVGATKEETAAATRCAQYRPLVAVI